MSITTSLRELHAVLDGQLGGQRHGFGVVAINVQDRRLDHLDDVGAVQASSARSRGSEVVKPIWLLMTMWTVPPVV